MQSVYELQQLNDNIRQMQLTQQTNMLRRNILVVIVISLTLIIIIVLIFLSKTQRLNKQLNLQKNDLTTSNGTKDKLFSIIGHDLRGPVGNIPVILEMLEDKSVSDADKAFMLESLKNQSQSIIETLDSLLFWGKSQIATDGLTNDVFNTGPSIEQNINLLSVSAHKKNIIIEKQGNVSARILGESSHYDFIVRNLLSNAIKFTPAQGRITIAVDQSGSDGYTVTSVKDTGVGISENQKQQIFEPGYTSAAGTNGENGNGIGLMLCKEFVTANGGKIWFESAHGNGTTFYFSFRSA